MVEGNVNVNVTGGPQPSTAVPKGKRIAAALIDLLAIPLVLGLVAGYLLVLTQIQSPIRDILMVCLNVAWLLVRDAIFSPGRKMVGLKLVTASGGKVSIAQAFVRNILLVVPVVLVVGYIVELVFILTKGDRLADKWAHTHVTAA